MSASTGQCAVQGRASSAAVITVTRGRPDPVELAVVTAVLLMAGAAAEAATPAEPAPGSLWADRARMLTAFPSVAAHSWRASALPR